MPAKLQPAALSDKIPELDGSADRKGKVFARVPPEISQTHLRRGRIAAEVSWGKVTTLAKIDWVHWMESAKQVEAQRKRATDAIAMLENGKKRVCCFDPSGFYSKAICCPAEAQ